jgi:NAD(P)-dependent dehydrogenase (short-subunit alcohol dehydrogenase family)
MTTSAHPPMSDLRFDQQLIVITGVGRAGQVGAAIALSLAQRGASLALLDLDAEQVSARAAEVEAAVEAAVQRGAHQRISAHAANLASPDDAARAAAEVLAAHDGREPGGVYAVVCVAGGFGMTGALAEADHAGWSRQFSINLETAFATTRAFLPAVRQARGSFVYFGSAAVLPGGSSKGMAAYAAAKAGVLSLMRTVAQDEKSHGVRANAVAPTAVRTTTNLADMGDTTDYVERESVADVVAFLVSPLARNVSGETIRLA